MKNGCLALLALVVFGWAASEMLGVISDGGNKAAQYSVAPISNDPTPVSAKTSSPEDCAGIMGSLKRSFPGPNFNNPKPGVFYMPPIVWTTATEENKKVVAQLLALQKGCESGTDPTYQTVEIRSITDNRLLAKGPIYDLEEQ